MYINFHLFIITSVLCNSISTDDVCTRGTCSCNKDRTVIHCDSRRWQSLATIEFPLSVRTLTLNDNNLKFETISDRDKIEKLTNLINLSVNKNPLTSIPPLNQTKIQSLALEDASITSAAFPSSYSNSYLRTISLKNNAIRTIKQADFFVLAHSPLQKLNLDDASISTIDDNAFQLLTNLQSLSLKNNLLQTCKFLLNLPLLSSIHLDRNRFTILPHELALPGRIKIYSFRNNRISTIDETSALNSWFKANQTDIQIYLANNSLDCCSSVWLIRFLKTAGHFVADASSLTCFSPAGYAGKLLIELDPDAMNCGGGPTPNPSWWSTGRILGLLIGILALTAIVSVAIGFYRRFRNHPSRYGYDEIGGNENEPLYRDLDPTIRRGPPFPTDEDDGYDTISSSVYSRLRSGPPSDAPTRHTNEGQYAADDNHVQGVAIEEEARIASDH